MNFAEIQTTWRSPQNRPSPEQWEKMKMKFVTDLSKRHRAMVAFLTGLGVALVVFTVKIGWQLIRPAAGTSEIDLAREWATIPFFALPWIGWIWMWVQYRRHRANHPDYARSTAASVKALLDDNRFERARYKMIALLQVASVVVLPAVVMQLRAVGKAGDEILVPAFVIFPAIIIAVFAGSTWRYRRTLLPRKQELEALLASYE